MKKLAKYIKKLQLILFVTLLSCSSAFASTTGSSDNIIETIIYKIQEMMTGPVATGIGIICIAGAGLYIAVSGDLTSGGKKASGIAIGVGIAVMAAKMFTWLGLTGAVI